MVKFNQCVFIIALALQLLLMGEVQAHPMAPSLLKIQEVAVSKYNIYWKQPIKTASPTPLVPTFPEQCVALEGSDKNLIEKGAVTRRWQVFCEQSMQGKKILITGLEQSRTTVLLNILSVDGDNITVLLTPHRPEYVISTQNNGIAVEAGNFNRYFLSGIWHLLEGYDHILLIACLLLLFRKNIRQLILIFSTFTLGHALSLGLALQRLIPISPNAVEILILLTLIWAALEVLNAPQPKPTYLKNYPYLLIMLFGLIHGAGFANSIFGQVDRSAISWWDLIGFNLGIEMAQIGLVLVIVPILLLMENNEMLIKAFKITTGYSVGGLSVFWLLQASI